MTKRSVGGYVFREQTTRIRNASRTTRESLQQLIESAPGPQQAARLMARATVAQTAILEAVQEIENIAERH